MSGEGRGCWSPRPLLPRSQALPFTSWSCSRRPDRMPPLPVPTAQGGFGAPAATCCLWLGDLAAQVPDFQRLPTCPAEPGHRSLGQRARRAITVEG